MNFKPHFSSSAFSKEHLFLPVVVFVLVPKCDSRTLDFCGCTIAMLGHLEGRKFIVSAHICYLLVASGLLKSLFLWYFLVPKEQRLTKGPT